MSGVRVCCGSLRFGGFGPVFGPISAGYEVPSFVGGADEVVAADPDEFERTAGGVEEREGVTYVEVVGGAAGDGARWCELGATLRSPPPPGIAAG